MESRRKKIEYSRNNNLLVLVFERSMMPLAPPSPTNPSPKKRIYGSLRKEKYDGDIEKPKPKTRILKKLLVTYIFFSTT